MEISYIQFYGRQIFNNSMPQIQVEEDGLNAHQRKLFIVHKFLVIHEGIQPDVKDQITCLNWHSRNHSKKYQLRLDLNSTYLLPREITIEFLENYTS